MRNDFEVFFSKCTPFHSFFWRNFTGSNFVFGNFFRLIFGRKLFKSCSKVFPNSLVCIQSFFFHISFRFCSVLMRRHVTLLHQFHDPLHRKTLRLLQQSHGTGSGHERRLPHDPRPHHGALWRLGPPTPLDQSGLFSPRSRPTPPRSAGNFLPHKVGRSLSTQRSVLDHFRGARIALFRKARRGVECHGAGDRSRPVYWSE